MAQIDPNDDRLTVEPTRLDRGRRPDVDPPSDPRVARSTYGNWGLIGGVAAVLVLGIVIFAMMGGNPSGPTPREQSQTTVPSGDPATTGATPPAAAPPAPGSAPPSTAPMTPGPTPPRQSP